MVESDRELLARFRRGDISAFDRLYERYKNGLFGFALSIVGRPAAAEDVVQEIFIRIFQRLDMLKYDGSFKSYLFSCVHHLSVDQLRRSANRVCALQEEPVNPLAPPDESAAQRDELERLRRLIFELPVEQRETVLLRIYEGLSFQEIAKIQEIPVGTVASRYHYGLDRIRQAFDSMKGVKP